MTKYTSRNRLVARAPRATRTVPVAGEDGTDAARKEHAR